jgi:hypothetical protein
MTVIDDSIEEAWLLRRNDPRKILKTSTNIFGLKVLASYTHQDTCSYYVKPMQASTSDIKDLRARARGKSTESEHQNDLKKMVLALDDKAQWEIQRLVESRDEASSNGNVRRLWEVVAFQTRPRRKISATAEKKWWKREKKPLVEWVMILRGETIDHQKRVAPVKHEDPWKAREKDVSAETTTEKASTSKQIEKTPMTMEEAQEKMSGVLAVLFTPAVDSAKGSGVVD